MKHDTLMSLLIFLLVFSLTIFLHQWLHRHIQALAFLLTGNPGCAVRLLFYLLLPGIFLHELSHYLAAKILLVPVKSFDIGIGRARSRQVSLGSVNVARSDPVRESIIGAAPFIVGIGAIWLIASWGFGLTGETNLSIAPVPERVQEYSRDWRKWLDLYLIFAVSTAMIPSESDRAPWGPVLIGTVFGIAALFLLGWTPRVPPDIIMLSQRVLNALTFALGIAVIVNGIVAIALWILERMIERVSGRRVEYREKRG